MIWDMTDLEMILDIEREYPARFAEFEDRPYGRLYFNPEAPTSWDSNHAVFADLSQDLEMAVKDLVRFYEGKSLVPRLMQGFIPGEKEKLIPLLEKMGFKIESQENFLMLHSGKKPGDGRMPLRIERITGFTDLIPELVVGGGKGQDFFGPWIFKVIEREMRHPDFHFFLGTRDNQPVAMFSLTELKGLARVDNVLVHHDFRGEGIGKAIMNHAIHYSSLYFGKRLFLYTSGEAAIGLYKKAGFSILEQPHPWWMACRE
jgi:hypothetical protein